MKKPKFLLIRSSVFPYDILFTTATDDEVIRYIEKNKNYELSDSEKELLPISGDGRTVMLNGGQTIVRVKSVKTKIGIDLVIVAHELQHAVFLILDRMGVKHTIDSDEVYSYYLAYLMRKVLDCYDPA